MAEMTLEGVDARPEDSAFALGRVHSIETMGTVDGPGIRFVVFVQGCPMRCAYCHNPDTWSVNGGTMVTVEHLMDEFQSNHEFYRSGGITVSGGEPLLQPEFLADLFRAMHNNPDGRVHTCLDSCGYAFDPQHPEKFDAVLNETDMVLLDIKHADPVEHKKLTGCDPARILAFGDELARRKIKVVDPPRGGAGHYRHGGGVREARSPHRSMAQRGGPGNAAVSHDGCRQVRATGHSL